MYIFLFEMKMADSREILKTTRKLHRSVCDKVHLCNIVFTLHVVVSCLTYGDACN